MRTPLVVFAPSPHGGGHMDTGAWVALAVAVLFLLVLFGWIIALSGPRSDDAETARQEGRR